MTLTIFSRVGTAGFLTLTLLTACASTSAMHVNAEAYFRSHIHSLSPAAPVLGGTFTVTDVQWEDSDTALVTYEDGHIMLTARADIDADASGNDVKIRAFIIVNDYGFGAISSNASNRDRDEIRNF